MAYCHDFNLANLPSDVVRQIIRVGQESIEDMKLITPRWHGLALEHLKDRKRLPAINVFSWHAHPWHATLRLRVAGRYLEYFGVKNRPWERHNTARYENSEWLFDVTCQCARTKCENGLIYPSIFRIISRCSRIERLEINVSEIKNNIGQFATAPIQLMGRCIIKEAALTGMFDFCSQRASNMLNSLPFLSVLSIPSVELSFISDDILETDIDEFRTFISAAVSIVPKVAVTARQDNNREWMQAEAPIDHWNEWKTRMCLGTRINATVEMEAQDDGEMRIRITARVEQ